MAKLFPSLCLVAVLALPIGAERATGSARGLYVKRAVDGDTLLLSNKVKVRLIGIDTPEWHSSRKLRKDAERNHRDALTIQKLGGRSARFVKELMEGREVHLKYEKSNRVQAHTDRYGRALAYVFFDPPRCEELSQEMAEQVCELDSFEKGFLNALIIEAGYANAYTRYPFSHKDEFLRLQKQARENRRGLWKESGPLTEKFPAYTGPAGQKT